MIIVHASISENGNAGWDGKAQAGDQTGKEVCTRSWYSKPWDFTLRYPDAAASKKACEIAQKLANSNLVGYDQSQRNTLYTQLEMNGWNVDAYIKSGVKSETDCSAFVYAAYCCVVPSMRGASNAPATSGMKSAYTKYGFTVYTDADHTTSTDYLLPGDVHVKAGTHTVMVCGTGAKATGTTTAATSGTTSTGGFDMSTLFNVKNGSTGATVKSLQILLNGKNSAGLTVDGQAGAKTVAAIKAYQKKVGLTADGECGPKTWAKILTA